MARGKRKRRKHKHKAAAPVAPVAPAAAVESAGVKSGPSAEPAPERAVWLEMWLLARNLVFAVGIALGVRWLVVEAFKIPTSSMEPALIGHENFGDRVLTFKPELPESMWITVGVIAACAAIGALLWRRRSRTAAWGCVTLAGLAIAGIFFAYSSEREPSRWDVYVFRPPHQPQRNYIKRVVGLPGEKLTIYGGDIFIDGKIARRPDNLQKKLWHRVYRLRWDPEPLSSWQPQGDAPATKRDPTDGSLLLQGQSQSQTPAFIKYQRLITNLYVRSRPRWISSPHETRNGEQTAPDAYRFRAMIDTARTRVRSPRNGEIISQKKILAQLSHERGKPDDYYPRRKDVAKLREVSDVRLSVNAALEPGTTLILRLTRGEQRYDVRFSDSGDVELRYEDANGTVVKKQANAFSVSAASATRFSAAHLDYQIIASVDGKVVLLHGPTLTPPNVTNDKIPPPSPTRPAIGVDGGQVRIKDIELHRDIHYLPLANFPADERWDDTQECAIHPRCRLQPLRQGRPNASAARSYLHVRRGRNGRTLLSQFQLGATRYFFLGDNSPSSQDSRAWGDVEARNLIGRAHFIFWPPSRWRSIR